MLVISLSFKKTISGGDPAVGGFGTWAAPADRGKVIGKGVKDEGK